MRGSGSLQEFEQNKILALGDFTEVPPIKQLMVFRQKGIHSPRTSMQEALKVKIRGFVSWKCHVAALSCWGLST